MNANGHTVIQIVQGSARAVAAEIEEATMPWDDQLREVVYHRLEIALGGAVADVTEVLALVLGEAS